ncbi:hypothetical protein PAXRUDRAFT_281481 [Paxillus rubicundulus Ve08.2h10]|uniref:Unplaced genomic scaffold scaffold_1472, whole genome shotgun sequence n=1 Tax=Paxillus rubicundulus Ve08.2h10 TaxID=930991 RepID=A0A0D0C914_9AGAM|nr:hypothetical protein PAXRUDRAFT_281481 [Paxillus rubicundulus Ve08.2h10]
MAFVNSSSSVFTSRPIPLEPIPHLMVVAPVLVFHVQRRGLKRSRAILGYPSFSLVPTTWCYYRDIDLTEAAQKPVRCGTQTWMKLAGFFPLTRLSQPK